MGRGKDASCLPLETKYEHFLQDLPSITGEEHREEVEHFALPLLDLQLLRSPYSGQCAQSTIKASLEWGIFQASNHGDLLQGMELELRKLEEHVSSIHDEMLYLREREEEMRNLNISTNSRMAWFSIMSFFVCLSVAAWQLWHLKSFFERKKLL